MSLIVFTAGGAMFGWLLPELVFINSERTGKIPVAFNCWCALAFALLAYGVRA
jgi:uncharacterized membrane protein YccF (DUF307 family)